MDFTVTTTITMRRVADLLCEGFEGSGGCRYWCRIMRSRKPRKLQAPVFGGGERYPYIDYPLTGGAVTCRIDNSVSDYADGEFKPLVLDRAAVERGLALMPIKAPKQWAAFIAGDDDSTTGDVFIQLCLLGDIVYG